MIEIKKGIPIPVSYSEYIDAVSRMEIGDCFDVDLNKAGITVFNLRAILSSLAKKKNIKFTTRLNEEEGILRVWRIA